MNKKTIIALSIVSLLGVGAGAAVLTAPQMVKSSLEASATQRVEQWNKTSQANGGLWSFAVAGEAVKTPSGSWSLPIDIGIKDACASGVVSPYMRVAVELAPMVAVKGKLLGSPISGDLVLTNVAKDPLGVMVMGPFIEAGKEEKLSWTLEQERWTVAGSLSAKELGVPEMGSSLKLDPVEIKINGSQKGYEQASMSMANWNTSDGMLGGSGLMFNAKTGEGFNENMRLELKNLNMMGVKVEEIAFYSDAVEMKKEALVGAKVAQGLTIKKIDGGAMLESATMGMGSTVDNLKFGWFLEVGDVAPILRVGKKLTQQCWFKIDEKEIEKELLAVYQEALANGLKLGLEEFSFATPTAQMSLKANMGFKVSNPVNLEKDWTAALDWAVAGAANEVEMIQNAIGPDQSVIKIGRNSAGNQVMRLKADYANGLWSFNGVPVKELPSDSMAAQAQAATGLALEQAYARMKKDGMAVAPLTIKVNEDLNLNPTPLSQEETMQELMQEGSGGSVAMEPGLPVPPAPLESLPPVTIDRR